ncbi:hypothetical protein [Croceibacterium selenioxidans]|uniref:hypothetical protein n=1 Tax=Croceibacterium selenioxidans TaxID=2838833 RepID=UPI00203232B0|nr:hypothetical protein [Croceibacterium selenioxidans]
MIEPIAGTRDDSFSDNPGNAPDAASCHTRARFALSTLRKSTTRAVDWTFPNVASDFAISVNAHFLR